MPAPPRASRSRPGPPRYWDRPEAPPPAWRCARRRHELARVGTRLNVEQDRAGLAVEREIIEQVADIHVELIADRDHGGKADPALGAPFHQSGRDGAGL